jgi:hypothetical protein
LLRLFCKVWKKDILQYKCGNKVRNVMQLTWGFEFRISKFIFFIFLNLVFYIITNFAKTKFSAIGSAHIFIFQ